MRLTDEWMVTTEFLTEVGHIFTTVRQLRVVIYEQIIL